MTAKICPSCQRLLPTDAPGGLCPACVLLGASGEIDPPAVPSLKEIQSAFPQFEILECIGRGGMGVVYEVRQPQLDRLLALKILLPGLDHDPGFAERFSREARALARLGHPNIVAVHDFGETGGYFWLTMEYVDRVNLRQAMQAARFTPAQALALIPDLCAALQYAHDHNILHRDIKPENILLNIRARVKIADFGIARIAGDDRGEFTLTRTGNVLGSTAYIAPEQIERPQDVDHRADLYSLGVVFYEMLTGELPLGRFPAPSEKSASDPRLDEVVFRSLEKDREKRYQTAEEFRDNLSNPLDPPVIDSTTIPIHATIPLTTAFAVILTSISFITGVPVARQFLAFWRASLKEGDALEELLSYLTFVLPSLTVTVIIPGLSGMIFGTVSLFMIRASNGRLRGIRLAGMAAFAWPVIFVLFVFMSLVFRIFFDQAQSDSIMKYLRLPFCLPLALLAGSVSKWLLASWLGVPRGPHLIWGGSRWPVIALAVIGIVLYFILAGMMTTRSSWPQ